MTRSNFKRSATWAAVAAALLCVAPALATPYGDPDDEPHVVTRVRDFFMVRTGQGPDPRIAAADLDFTRNMQHHHRGALEMARLYLEDPRGTNPVLRRLAHTIITNQQFEIAVLDNVRQTVEPGPRRIADWGGRQVFALDRGVDGLEHVWQFSKAPPPSLADVWLTRGFRMSDFDVQFARPMVLHHEMALQMARTYNTDPVATNAILRRMNVEILIDQKYEIGLLQALLDRYPGEVAAVLDDPRMMAAMQRSMAGMHDPSAGHAH